MEETLVLQISRHLPLDWLKVGEYVAMGNDDAAWIGSSTGRKDDFDDVVGTQCNRTTGIRRILIDCFAKTLQFEMGNTHKGVRRGADTQLCTYLISNPG